LAGGIRGIQCQQIGGRRGATLHYIENQAAHHQKQTFQDEFRALLVKHEIAFDEKWLWG
jgi:hypothetical protein